MTEENQLQEIKTSLEELKKAKDEDLSGFKSSLDGGIDAATKLLESEDPAEQAQAGLDLISSGLDMLVAVGLVSGALAPVSIALHTFGKLIYAFGKSKKKKKDPIYKVMEVLLKRMEEMEVKIPVELTDELIEQNMDDVEAILNQLVDKYDIFITHPNNDKIYEEMLTDLDKVEDFLEKLKLSIIRLGSGKGHAKEFAKEYSKLAIRLLPRMYMLNLRYVFIAAFKILPEIKRDDMKEETKQRAEIRSEMLIRFLKDMKTRYDELLIGDSRCATIFKLQFHHLQKDLVTYRKYFNCKLSWLESGFALTDEDWKSLDRYTPVYLVVLDKYGVNYCKQKTTFQIRINDKHIVIDGKYYGIHKKVTTWFWGSTGVEDHEHLFTYDDIKKENRDDTGKFNSYNSANDSLWRHNAEWKFETKKCDTGRALKIAPILDNYYSYTKKSLNHEFSTYRYYSSDQGQILQCNGDIKKEDKKENRVYYYVLPTNFNYSFVEGAKFPIISGTYWSWAHDGTNRNGRLEFLRDGTTKWDDGEIRDEESEVATPAPSFNLAQLQAILHGVQHAMSLLFNRKGSWRLMDEGKILETQFNDLSICHKLKYDADTNRAVLLMPERSPSSQMWCKGFTFPNMALGTHWSWANDGTNKSGDVEFLGDGAIKWNNVHIDGYWKLKKGGVILETVFGKVYHELKYDANTKRAIVITPASSTPSQMWCDQVYVNVTLQSKNYPKHYIAVDNTGRLKIMTQAGHWGIISDTKHPGYIKLLSQENGKIARHRSSQVHADSDNGSDLFDLDSAFKIVPSLCGDNRYISFESLNYPGYFIRHAGYVLWIHQSNGSTLFKEDASFRVNGVSVGTPIDRAFKNIAKTANGELTVDMDSRPTAHGQINEAVNPQTGSVTFPDDREYKLWYYPEEATIYWDGPRGKTTITWRGVPEVLTPIDRAFKNIAKAANGELTVDMDSRPTAHGQINEAVNPQTGSVTFPDDREYKLWYYPEEATIYWDGPRGKTTITWRGVPEA